MDPIGFAIVGTGWRAAFYERIAAATCLAGMPAAIAGGPDVCSLADAVQDRYLDLLVDEAVATGQPVRSGGHVWAGG